MLLLNRHHKLPTFRRVVVQQLMLEQVFQNLVRAPMPANIHGQTIKNTPNNLNLLLKIQGAYVSLFSFLPKKKKKKKT